MIVGFALGTFRMLVDTPVSLGLRGLQNGYPPGSFLWIINNIYFQYFSVLITIVSAIVMVSVSYMTPEPDYGKIQSLTFSTTTAELRRPQPQFAAAASRRLLPSAGRKNRTSRRPGDG